ncbi:hypothetical protein [Streptomyces sp. Isolate_219]|uniref:hypothetical protein n=1 Tax=Streptomyces sp. Isolate_219 TaxID=2950110 RepID=UPI0021C5D1DC|nr:hypothetical protein [Streptomyces sp. Isolate_219]MCR8576476.1 hypothetical protein [Streptomyces sp. Isolate_219]
MARTVLTATQFTRDGATLPAGVAGDAVNGNSLTNEGATGIIVENTGATTRNVTFHVFTTVDGLAVTPRTESIPAGAVQGFGPFPVSTYSASLLIDVDNAELTLSAVRV